MSVSFALIAVTALLAVGVSAGILWRVRQGRARRVSTATPAVDAARLGAGPLGQQATLLQFSTELCARCPQVRRKLSGLAEHRAGVVHLEVDLTHRPELAARFHVLQTPTTFLLDADGAIRSRFGGVPAPGAIEHELSLLVQEDAHV